MYAEDFKCSSLQIYVYVYAYVYVYNIEEFFYRKDRHTHVITWEDQGGHNENDITIKGNYKNQK